MKTSFLPLASRALAVTAVGVIFSTTVSTTALAQTPAPGAPATPPAVAAATPAPKPLSPTEKNFVKNAGKSLYYQIQLATAAKTAITDEKLVKMRDTTIRDLNKAWEALNNIAKVRSEPLAAELTGSDKTGIERLGKMKDEKFVKQWLEELMKESKRLDKDFESAGKSGQDPDLKSYVGNYTPIVHNVFISAEAAEKGLKKK